jgi:cobalamin biosynthetic protein CobC
MGSQLRDHGGNIDLAIDRYGGLPGDWIDLSTGVNRMPYPIPPLAVETWTALPTQAAQMQLLQAARLAFVTKAPMLAVSGAQAAIQIIPRLGRPGRARVLAPTYNEHAVCLRAAGWQVEEVACLNALERADLAVIVNPNNPDGRTLMSEAIMRMTRTVGLMVVDESFVDTVPELSVAPMAGRSGLIVLRSFGKFYGLAGLRLGFVLGSDADIARLSELAGPWPVAGPALAVGILALADRAWAEATRKRLASETVRIDALAATAGWRLVGGTALFRLYDTPDGSAAQDHLARAHIWSRVFPAAPHWIRLGLPGSATEWHRLAAALNGIPHGV